MKRTFILTLLMCIQYTLLSQVISFSLPKNQHTQINQEVRFNWGTDLNAVSYQLDITDSDLTLLSFNVVTNDTVIILPYQHYYATVTPIYTIGSGDVSNSVEFTVLDVLSFSPRLWLNSDSSVVFNVSNQVELWTDISGNGNHVTQINAASKPTYVASSSELNDHPTISFDGNDVLNSPNMGLLNVEIFVVVKGNNVNNSIFGFGFGYHVNFVSTRPILYLQGSNYRYFQGLQPTGIYQMQNISWLNGSASDNSTFLKINSTEIPYSTSVDGSGYILDNLSIGSGTLNGFISEILVFEGQLDNVERESIESYLFNKYAPPVNLGTDISLYGFCDTTLHAGDRFTSYLWSNGTTGESITVSESGTYWVQVTDIFGFTSSDTIVVTYPEVEQPTNLLFCPGDDIVWNANLGADYDYLWSTGETTESITINTEDTYFVTITDTNGCQRVSDALFFEEDPFASTVSLGPDVDLCSGNSIALVSGMAETVSYLWGGGETTPSIVVNTTDTYTVEVENANGCVATDDVLVTIIGDAPVVQIGMNPSYCQQETVDFTDNSYTTDASTIVSWDWDFGDLTGSTDESGTHVYNDYGPFTVQLTVTTDAGCENTGDQVVEIFQKPIIYFSTVNECQSDPINFYSNQSTLPFITNWMWNFDDPASGSDNTATGEISSHAFVASGDYNVELMAEDVNGCRDTVVQIVSILPTPQVAFTFNEVCVGQTVNFTNQTTIEDPYLIATTQWQLGGGATSSQFSPSRLYVNAGTFNVTLTVTANNGCSQQLTQPLKIHALPIPDYIFSPSCAGLPTVFTDASTVPDGSVALITWQFNANNPVNGFTVAHTFTNPGTQQVRQQVVSVFGCQYTTIRNMETNPALSAGFSVDSDLILAGTTTLFNNESVGAELSEWEIGSYYSGIDESPELVFPLDAIGDTINVRLIVSNSFGCSDTLYRELVIFEAITDLAVTQVFLHTNTDGYMTLGAELSNLGSSTITQADLYLRMDEDSPIKSTWNGELRAGEKEVYIFPLSPYQSVNTDKENERYICVEGRITLPAGLEDENPSNNEFCRNISGVEAILLIPYPNPVSSELSIRVIMPKAETVDIHIFDASGRLVYTIANNAELQVGLNTFTINVSNWSEGSYTIYLQTKEIRKTVRFVKS